jgi:hypothetical protein
VVAHETPLSVAFESVEQADVELANVARKAGLLRLGLADGLEELARAGGHHELGFPTIAEGEPGAPGQLSAVVPDDKVT